MSSSTLLHQALVFVFISHVTTLPISPDTNDTSVDKPAWSKEAILGLITVLVTITLFTIGLATGRLRKWIVNLLKCMPTLCVPSKYIIPELTVAGCKPRRQSHTPQAGGISDSPTQLLRRRAEEWLEFNEWRRLVESSALS